MGVKGLWDLLAPAGRRVKINTLEGKVLAIDVSIWLLKVLHGSVSLGQGEFRNIHLIGILRRIIKLMFYGIKPVFVFDGKFPELKRETVKKRQMMRENRSKNLKKLAEKYLTKVLEEKILENIGRIPDIRKNQKQYSYKKISGGDEDEETDTKVEKEKKEHRRKQKMLKEDKNDKEDTMVFDYEFETLLEENKELLEESGIDMEEFSKQDNKIKYKTIKIVQNRARDKKLKRYEAIDNLEDLSKTHIKDYINSCKRKARLEKNKEIANTKKMANEQETVLGNIKYSDLAANDYMRTLFVDPAKNVMQNTLASNRNKGYIYIVQNDKKYNNQTLKLERKRQNKYERMRKLNKKLCEIARNTESLPSLFTSNDLLCENPLDALLPQESVLKLFPSKNSKDLAYINELSSDNKIENLTPQNVDIDEVFGFGDWQEDADHKALEEIDVADKLEEKKDASQEDLLEVKNEGEVESEDVFDLFEYKAEEHAETNEKMQTEEPILRSAESDSPMKRVAKEIGYQTLTKPTQSDSTIDSHTLQRGEISPEIKNKESNLFESKEQIIAKDADHKQFENRKRRFFETVFFEDEKNENSNITHRGQEIENLSTRDTIIRQCCQKPQTPPKNIDILNGYDKEEEQQGLGDTKQDLFESHNDKITNDHKPNSPRLLKKMVTEGSYLEESEENASIRESSEKSDDLEINYQDENLEIKDDEIFEIQYEKNEADLKSTKRLEPEDANNERQNLLAFPQDENLEDMDEERILDQMKDIEDGDVLDKWILMEHFQKFQNLSELEGDSIQEKLREIKELLIILGIPWVDSPAEAEAQCAFLESIGLVDGVITDDSDVFLFGAKRVYRNIFDKGDNVLSYPMDYVENELGLDREKLILMALFLGSDYTVGIRGVGIVNALEIIRGFDSIEALQRFKAWAELPDVLMEDFSTHYKDIPMKELEYKLFHRNFKKNWELPDNFPDKRVIEAYEKPLVDLSEEKFAWGKPDIGNLEELCRSRFRWDEGRINNSLEPLKKALRERTGQKKITDFFREEKIAVINSKRMNTSIQALQNKDKQIAGEEQAYYTDRVEKKLEKQNNLNLRKRRQGDDVADDGFANFAFKKHKKTQKVIT